jgi:hypothetical protein
MNSSFFTICFITDTTLDDLSNKKNTLLLDELNDSGASGNGIPNKDIFTISTLLNTKIQIIPNNRIADLQKDYKINFPHIKLWIFDINKNIDTNFEKLGCIILFINAVYGIHYVCNIDNYTIKQQKQYITDIVIPNYKLYKHTQNNDDKYEFNVLINTFDSNGNTKTSVYETI